MEVIGVGIKRPIPVRLSTFVPAFFTQHGLVRGYVETVPRQEVADEVHAHGLLDVGVEEVIVAGEDSRGFGGWGCEGGFFGEKAVDGGDVGGFFGIGEGAPFFSDEWLLAAGRCVYYGSAGTEEETEGHGPGAEVMRSDHSGDGVGRTNFEWETGCELGKEIRG